MNGERGWCSFNSEAFNSEAFNRGSPFNNKVLNRLNLLDSLNH